MILYFIFHIIHTNIPLSSSLILFWITWRKILWKRQINFKTQDSLLIVCVAVAVVRSVTDMTGPLCYCMLSMLS